MILKGHETVVMGMFNFRRGSGNLGAINYFLRTFEEIFKHTCGM